MSILKRLFCNHTYEFLSNISGPLREYYGWNCTVYKCTKCGKQKFYKDYIHKKYDWGELESNVDWQIQCAKIKDEYRRNNKFSKRGL